MLLASRLMLFELPTLLTRLWVMRMLLASRLLPSTVLRRMLLELPTPLTRLWMMRTLLASRLLRRMLLATRSTPHTGYDSSARTLLLIHHILPTLTAARAPLLITAQHVAVGFIHALTYH